MIPAADGPPSVTVPCRRPVLSAALCCLVVLGLMPRGAGAAEPNENALWLLWNQQASTNAVDHEALLAACQGFTNQYPSDPSGPVVQTMAAWNLLHLGRQAEAAAVLARQLDRSGTPLESGASYLAKAWLTRIDREKVKAALQFYYRREVRYPRSIDELVAYAPLPKDLRPPGRDRWGANWVYALVGFKSLSGLLDQQYEISAQKLGNGSELAAALAVPYGGMMHVRPNRMLSSKPGSEIVEWLIAPSAASPADAQKPKPAERTVALGVNSTSEGLSVAYIGRTILIVYDTYHWKLLARPADK